MPVAYSVGATPPLTRKDGAGSRFRPSTPAGGGSDLSPTRHRFLRSPLASTGRRDEHIQGGKIPWDSPASPIEDRAPSPTATRRNKTSQREQPPLTVYEAWSPALDTDFGHDDDFAGADEDDDTASSLAVPSSGSTKAGGRLRALVHKGSKFSLRALREHHHSAAAAPRSPPTSPSSASSRFHFPTSTTSDLSRAASFDLLQPPTPATSTRVYPREISSPQSGRTPPLSASTISTSPFLATPLPSPAFSSLSLSSLSNPSLPLASERERKGSAGRACDEDWAVPLKGSVGGKAARLLGEEVVPSGKAAKVLGMERKKTLVKKPSVASLWTTDEPERPALPSFIPYRPKSATGHARQRSLSVPARSGLESPIATSPRQRAHFPKWQPPSPESPSLMSLAELSDPGASPTNTLRQLRSRSPSPVPAQHRRSSSLESFPLTARVTSFASSAFHPHGGREVPSFVPSLPDFDFRNSTFLEQDPDGLPPLETKRLSPASIRFSAIFGPADGPGVEQGVGLFGSSAGTSPRTSRGADPGNSASKRSSLGPRSFSTGSTTSTLANRRSSTRRSSAGKTSTLSSSSSTGRPISIAVPPPPPPPPPLLSLPPVPVLNTHLGPLEREQPHVTFPLPPPPPASLPLPAAPAYTLPAHTVPFLPSLSALPPPATPSNRCPKRSDTLVSTASSHTRRSQRSHALDALEGRRSPLPLPTQAGAGKERRPREREESEQSAASVDSIGEMERRAFEECSAGVVAFEQPQRKKQSTRRSAQREVVKRQSRPFLEMDWSSDDGDASLTPVRQPRLAAPQDSIRPTLPRSSSLVASGLTRAPVSAFSSSSSSAAATPQQRLSPAPLVPLSTPHVRSASKTSNYSTGGASSILSLSESDDDGDKGMLGAFPSPPLAGLQIETAGEGYGFPVQVAQQQQAVRRT
ncbi:uncharacterized protein JCM10292_004948 [Rhodotorula paludigena]|uniref:uncharacterized protein n=1 Tax=Rhodotorula paludigena TaxID=86838 RepID=UPI003172CD9D